jgi:helix-turn-helix protein
MPASKPDEQIAYNIGQLVALTGSTKTHLYAAMQAGELAFSKLGRRRVVLAEDLLAYLRRHRIGGEGVEVTDPAGAKRMAHARRVAAERALARAQAKARKAKRAAAKAQGGDPPETA